MIDVERLEHDRDYWDEVGAPEDATHYIIPNSPAGSKAGFFVETDDRYIRIGSGGHYRLKEDLHMYSLIPRPARKQWSGPEDGLPPVGTECEFAYRGSEVCIWSVCKPMHYGQHAVFLKSHREDVHGMKEYSVPLRKVVFRPLKSEKERVVEWALSQDCEPHEGTLSRTDFCGRLYDLGALKMPEEDQ